MKHMIAILSVTILSACGKGDPGQPGAPGQVVYIPTPPAAPSDEQKDIDTIIADENEYRTGLGQTALTSGLSCTLYTITGGQFIQNDATHTPTLTGLSQVATFLHKDVFNQLDGPISDGMSVLPAPLRAVYQNMYMLRCQGQIVVTKTAYYQFDLRSDDGSVLYLDGARLIDNDGAHAPQTKTGSKYLRRGVHTFRLDYAQSGGGSQALVLTAGGALIPGAYLFH